MNTNNIRIPIIQFDSPLTDLIMEQFYRIVLELYKEAIQGSLNIEALKEAQTELAKEITRVHIMGKSDTELHQLVEDLNTLDLAMAE